MATRNPAQQADGVTSLSDGQFLEYRIKPQVAGTFAWVDGSGTAVLTHKDFPPMANEWLWQLKAATANGVTKLTVAQNPAYSNTGRAGEVKVHILTLGFFTSPGYTVTVTRFNAAGSMGVVSQFSYSGGVATDNPAEEGIQITLA